MNIPIKIKNSINKIFSRFGYQFRKIDSGFSLNRNLKWLQQYEIQTILDLGANEGQFAEFIRTVFPKANIICFEPLYSCFKVLSDKFNNDSSIEFLNIALGDFNGQFEMYSNDFSPSSSLLKMKQEHITNFPFTEKAKIENIKVKTLDSIADDLILNKEVLVKIDVQGFEGNVLKGGMKFFATIPKIVIIETSIVELYENEMSFGDIYDIFLSLGYKYAGNMNQLYSPVDGKILQVDAIFIK